MGLLKGLVPCALLDDIAALNDKITLAKTTEDCVAIAKEVFDLLKAHQQTNGQTLSSTKENHGTVETVEGNSSSSEGLSSKGTGKESLQPKDLTPGNSDVQGCASEASATSMTSQSRMPNGDSVTDLPSGLQSFFDISTRIKSEIDQHVTQGSGKAYGLPEGPLGMNFNRRGDFTDKARAVLESGRRNSVGLRRQLQGLVQARGRAQKRLCERGRDLNRSKVARLSLWNPRVFNRWTEHPTTETAVHLLVDMSGSMRGERERVAAESAIALFLALHSLPGCNPAISIFQGRGRTISVFRHGEALTESTKARLSAFEAGGGTPLFRALGDVLVELSMTKEKRKVIFVITDGDPDSPHETHALVKLIEKTPDTDIVGIGIYSETGWLFEKSVRIDDIGTLSEVLFSLAKDMALAGIR